jgi:hypothetical protein
MAHVRGIGVLVVVAGIVVLGGCSRRPAERPKPAAQKVAIPLPEWAPKNPSPEFLRAARVLKPMPGEEVLRNASTPEQVAHRRLFFEHIFPRTWELFGSLSDGQVGQFRAHGRVWVPVRQMTEKQRAAFQNLLNDFQRLKALGQDLDLRVFLYKMGAKEDLSNVKIGFSAGSDPRHSRSSHVVMFEMVIVGKEANRQGIGPIGLV